MKEDSPALSVSGLVTALVFCLFWLGGCAVGPDYARPKVAVPETFKEAGSVPQGEGDWRVAQPGMVDISPWWAVFNDPVLNALMPQLAAANPDIQTARANVRQARAVSREVLGSFLPSVGASGSASRGQTGGSAAVGNTYRAQLSASWELDIFGGTRRSFESASASEEASEAALAQMLLSMRAELAQLYFQLRSLDEQLALYTQTIAAYTRSLAITENQHSAGVALRIDVAQAEAQRESAKAQAVALELNRRQTEHAIAALLGLPPAIFTVAPASLDAKLPRIESALPSTLLERRPDIAAAERRMAAANARIGIAVSAYYPVFSLTGSGGYNATSFAEWFSLPNRIWSVGSSATLALFQGGALQARTEQAVATWEASVAAYRKTVLGAFREVEDQLAAATLLEQEEAIRLSALKSSREAESLALNQYRAGISSYLTVVTTQATALANARSAASLKGQRFVAAVALIRALGGGWHTPEAGE